MNDKSSLNISRPFGPTLGLANIPQSLIKKINNFIDLEVISHQKKLKN